PGLNVQVGSCAEMLKLNISSPLPPTADAPTPPGTPPWPRTRLSGDGAHGQPRARPIRGVWLCVHLSDAERRSCRPGALMLPYSPDAVFASPQTKCFTQYSTCVARRCPSPESRVVPASNGTVLRSQSESRQVYPLAALSSGH